MPCRHQAAKLCEICRASKMAYGLLHQPKANRPSVKPASWLVVEEEAAVLVRAVRVDISSGGKSA